MKKKIHTLLLHGLLPALLLLATAACSKGYNEAECTRLSEMVATGRALSQDDYASMIAQSDCLLHHLINVTTDTSSNIAEGDTADVRTRLHDDPDFTSKLDQLFTFSSVLYRAHLNNTLDAENSAAYEALDSTSEHFARLCSAL